jgi:hypothetical protein
MMEQVLVVTDTTSGDAFAIITEKNGSLRFFGMTEPGKEWTLWLEAATNGRGRLEEIVKKLSVGLSANGPKPMTRKVRSELAENLPKVSESDHQELTTGRVESKSLEGGVKQSRRGLSHKQWNALVNYKALSFINDQNLSSITYDLKSARAVFDPDLAGGNGGFRCPVGTRYGGQITDRYGRGCGWGVARRIVNAVGDTARRVERRLDDRRKRRVERRNRRVGRQIGLDKPNKPGRSRRGVATRLEDFADRRDQRQGRGIATRLEDFADRRDERQGVGRRSRRGTTSVDTPPPVRRNNRRQRELDVPEEVQPESVRSRRRSASIDRVNDQPEAAKRPATVPAVQRPRPAKKVVAKKRVAKKAPAKKAPAKKAPAKKAAAKKAVAKKAPAKKAVARPAKKAAAKKASTRRPNTSEAQAGPSFDDLDTQDQRWVLDQLDRRFADNERVLERRIADPDANLQVDIESYDRQIERALIVVNNVNQDDRHRVFAAEKVNRLKENNRRLRNALENREAPRPAKKVAAKKRAAKKAVASRNAETQERRRLQKIEQNLNDWVDGVADDRERLKVIAGFEEEKQRLRALVNDAPSGGESALDQEYALYEAAIRRLRERNLPPPPRFDADANANPRRDQRSEALPGFQDLDLETRARVRKELEAVYQDGGARERENNRVTEAESIQQLQNRIAFLQNDVIPSSRKKAKDKNLPLDQRVFYAESVAIHQERIDAYKAGIERKKELAAANPPEGELSPEKIEKLEKDMAKRYANLRKKRGGIVGKWMIKTYGNEDPPPWETDKNIKIEELRNLVRGNAADKARVKEWVKQVYAIDEVVGRNGLRFRVQIQNGDIDASGQRISFAGTVQAFNTDTNEWENIGKTARTLSLGTGLVSNDKLMIGTQGGYPNPFANGAKNEGFTSVYNPHAFTWLKASGFERANVGAIGDGRFVWGRYGFRQEMVDLGRGRRLADNLMEEVKKYRNGERDGLIRTDLDADLIEYLTSVAKQKDFSIDAPQHPEYILALAGDKNFTEAEKVAYDQKLQEWFVNVSPFGTGVYDFNDQNVPDDPRKLV